MDRFDVLKDSMKKIQIDNLDNLEIIWNNFNLILFSNFFINFNCIFIISNFPNFQISENSHPVGPIFAIIDSLPPRSANLFHPGEDVKAKYSRERESMDSILEGKTDQQRVDILSGYYYKNKLSS